MQTTSFNLVRRMFISSLFLLIAILLLCEVELAHASEQVDRPIQTTGGKVNQFYLYGETFGLNQHRGIDFPYATGTDVYAVADGEVVAVREIDNNGGGSFFGNYVMIRHDELHYDRSANQMAWVYSIYAHLSHQSVTVNTGQTVNAGANIAEVDNTGNSSGPHLHLQINLSTDGNKTDPQEWTWSEYTSRNPEAWIEPFDYGGAATATAIGRISDNNGNRVGGKLIVGIQKPAAAGGSTAGCNGYTTSLTYEHTWANPDDLVIENFATTDVQPGTYHLYAYDSYNLTTCTPGNLYRDLGEHTFVAGQTTYIGLDVVYLPDIRVNWGGYTSTVTIRNNHASRTAKATTTLFHSNGDVAEQREEESIPPSGSISFTPSLTLFGGSALVSASEDVSVAVVHEHSNPYALEGYAGVEDSADIVHVPLLHRNNSSWYSRLYIHNPNNQAADVDVTYTSTGGGQTPKSHTIEPWGFANLYTGFELSGTFIGSAKVVNNSDQPLGVVSTQFPTSGATQLMAASNSQKIATKLFAPLMQNNNSGYESGLALLNASSSQGSFTVNYYNGSGGGSCDSENPAPSIPANRTHIIFPAPPLGNPCNVVVSGVFDGSTRNLAANVNQLWGTTQATTYSAISAPSKTVTVPRLKRGGGWSDGFVIRNTAGSTANITVTFYNTNGTTTGASINQSINAGGFLVVLGQLPNPFDGSALVTSNQNIAVSVNNLNSGSGDIIASYPAEHR